MHQRVIVLWAALACVVALLVPASAGAVGATTVLSEGFESGAPGWQFTGFWHVQDRPEDLAVSSDINPKLVTLADSGSLPPAFDGSHVAWFGQASTGTFCGDDYTMVSQSLKDGCTSGASQTGYAQTPPIDLSNTTTAELDFSSWWEIESVDANAFDVMAVEYSTDVGATWNPLGSLNPTDNPAGNEDQSYTADGLEEPGAWHHYIADLSPAAGHANVELRFQFSTNDQLYNGFRGWLLDDVRVTKPFSEPAPAITSVYPSCITSGSTGLIAAYGSSFVLGSRVLLDGSPVTGSLTSDERLEFVAPATDGSHQVQIISPDGAASNKATVTVAASCSSSGGRYVALGDSYSSGEGVPPFLSPTDSSSDQCHRATESYSELLVQQHAGGVIPSSVDFWACSGSVTSDFLAPNHAFGEPPQLDHLAPGDATLVSFSIGGNDIGFANIGATCLKVSATIFKQLNSQYKENCRNVLGSSTMSRIQNLPLSPLFADIRARAPLADVYVMGYPDVLPENPSSDCQAQAYREDGRKATGNPFDQSDPDGIVGVETRIGQDDVAWMNKIISRLNGKIKAAAAGAGFHFVDNENAFQGHDLCNNNTDPSNRPWAHGLVLFDKSNSSPPNPSAFSFHPNSYGQAKLEDDLYNAIKSGAHVTIHPSETKSLQVSVAAAQQILNLIIKWPGSDVVTSLTSPSGQVFDRSTPGISHFVTATTENYAIPNPEPGTWTVQLYGANVAPGGEDVRVDSSTTAAADLAPVAVAAAAPSRTVESVPVRFTGAQSSATDGTIASYVWSFGDGSAPAAGPTASHVYPKPGTYHAMLTVSDTAGRTDTAVQTVVIDPHYRRPLASLSVLQDPHNDAHIFYDGSNSTDPDGLSIRYRLEFGDDKWSAAISGFHGYRYKGTYRLTLAVTNSHGLTGKASSRVRVTHARHRLITRLRITPHSLSQRAPGKRGIAISYRDALRATTIFTVLEPARGTRRDGRCVPLSRSKSHGKGRRCTAYRVLGKFKHHDRKGRNKLRFDGRLGGHVLKPGTYRLQVVGRISGFTSAKIHTRLSIAR